MAHIEARKGRFWVVRWQENGRRVSRQFGDPEEARAFHATFPAPIKDPVERFWAKVQRGEGCWNWLGAITSAGYGNYWHGGRSRQAHRLAYEWTVGPIPGGLFIDHACHNRACVNPSHLRPATYALNNQNQRGARVDNKLGVRGVWWSKAEKKYRVGLQKDGKHVGGGGFSTLEEAEAAAIALRAKHFTYPGGSR